MPPVVAIPSPACLPIISSVYGTAQPPWANPPRVSSSGRPGACMTPSSVTLSNTTILMSAPPRGDGGPGDPRPPSSVVRSLAGKAPAGLQQGLEVAEDLAPAAARALILHLAAAHGGKPRGAFEVVDHRELADARPGFGDLPGEPGEALRGRSLVSHQHAERLDQPVRRVSLEHLAVDGDLGDREAQLGALPLHPLSGVGPVGPTGTKLVVHHAAHAVPFAPFGLGDGVPDRLGRGLDVHLVHLGGRLGLRGHPVSSSRFALSSTRADTRRSVYLSIHRSWISRIGTGFRKWSFCLPRRRVTTRPASSRTRRCFITPKRVMSCPDSSSPSVRPSRSKSRSSRDLRVGSARALNTRSSSVMALMIRDHLVTCQEGDYTIGAAGGDIEARRLLQRRVEGAGRCASVATCPPRIGLGSWPSAWPATT